MAQFRAKAEELERKNLENQEEILTKDRYIRDVSAKREHQEERFLSEEQLLQNKEKELVP
jgi:hypothetical protein